MRTTPTLRAPINFPTDRPRLSHEAGGDLKAPSARLVSLDAYRGFVMLLMASSGLWIGKYVHDAHATGIWDTLAFQTDHVQWRGCSLWDLIQPSFTFIVGVALPFSLAKRRSQGQSFGWLTFHAVIRSLVLIFLGIFLRSMHSKMTNFTFEDTLTQIGLGYTFAFMLSWAKPSWQISAIVISLLIYWFAFALYPLPSQHLIYSTVGLDSDWYAKFGLRNFSFLHPFAARWDKNTNFAADFDVIFLNRLPRSSPFRFNGGGYLTLSFIPTLATMLLGLQAGNLMRRDLSHRQKFARLIFGGCVGILVGMILDRTGVCPSVKRIWTPSWVLFSGGWACLLLAVFYAVIDWGKIKWIAFPAVVVGMNSIAMYCLSDGGFGDLIHDSFKIHGVRTLITKLAGAYWPIAEMSLTLLVLWLVCYWMYRRKIFIRI